jgi:hypothetical protein
MFEGGRWARDDQYFEKQKKVNECVYFAWLL